MKEPIDFVITWVDGADEQWLKDKEKYTGNDISKDACRYRDWDLLRYWFRGVEKFAPWVNKIHFVTYGHLPVWLNTEHPKLNIVNHWDFIPYKYLPTFNSHTIELNLHRIKGLSDKFVYFNDDIFLTNYVEAEDFFVGDYARDTLALEPLRFDSQSIAFIDANNIALINDIYKKKPWVKKHIFSLIDPVIGFNKIMKNILLLPFPYFTGFYNHHLASSFFVKSYELAWRLYEDKLDKTCMCKIRARDNVNQWLMKDLQIVEGVVKTRSTKFGCRMNIRNGNYKQCARFIENQKFKMICVNDNEKIKNLNIIVDEIKVAFGNILYDVSSYEKV